MIIIGTVPVLIPVGSIFGNDIGYPIGVYLKSEHFGDHWDTFEHDCVDEVVPAGKVLWHLVLNPVDNATHGGAATKINGIAGVQQGANLDWELITDSTTAQDWVAIMTLGKNIYGLNKSAFGQENESKLVEKIRKGSNFIPELSLIAEIDGRIVGYILLSRIKIINNHAFKTLSLAPMAVLHEFQNKGIGSGLIKKGLEKAKELGFDSVIVLGHEKYYPGFGFKKAAEWDIKCPFEVPEEAFMALELTHGALEGKAGTIKYPDEFMEDD